MSYSWLCTLQLVFIEVELIYNIVLVSGVQQSDSVFLKIIFHYSYYKVMGIIPCAVQ